MIAVPRSPRAPHAVLVNNALRFPKRNGSTTRYLSEPEVAAGYRDRHAGQEYQSQRAVEIERDALARLDISDLPWIVVSLIPDLPDEFTISQASYRTFHQHIVNTPVTIVSSSTYTRARTGRRRLLADGTLDQAPHARWAALELHTDGAGVYATSVANLTRKQQWVSPPAENDQPPVQLINDESIVIGILSGLLCLAQHARDRTATGGGVLVRAQLHPISPTRPTQIGHFTETRSRYSVTEPPHPAETTAALNDLALAGPDLVAVTCRLADELGQAFGVPEMGQLSPTGELRLQYWNHASQERIKSWAKTNGITVIE